MIRPAAAAYLDRVREIVEAAYTKYVPRIGRRPAPMDDNYGIRLQDGALFELRLFTNEKMTENVALYRHLGFKVTHRAEEDGFRRVYLRKTLA